MMYDTQATVTGVGISGALALSPARHIWAVSLQTAVSGTATYDIEATIDGINWVKTLTGLTAGAVSNIQTPCKGLRINITAGTGSVTFTLLEIR